jgi:septation ring formation regulator
MIKYIIIVVVVALLAAVVAGFLTRRKHRAVVLQLESEKLQIQHYPIFEELTKLKSLNMNGQTEEMFEKWRNNWTEVIDVDILKINSLLFDLEDSIDHFQFKKSKNLQREIQERMASCEERRLNILKELEELIGSEEKNRIEMEQLKDYYRSARKTVLAHQHSFGPALTMLEERLAAFNPSFVQFDELTEQGNYLEAREVVLKLNTEAQTIYTLLSEIPTLLSEIQTKIPASIHDLRNGLREMEEQGYYLAHLELAPYLEKTEKELKELKVRLANLEVDFVRERTAQIVAELDGYYDLLEREVHSKAYVDKQVPHVHTILTDALALTREVHTEVQFVQSSYCIADEEVEIPKTGIKQLEGIKSRYEALVTQLEQKNAAFSTIEEELKGMSEEIERTHERQDEFSNGLKNLRIDELHARTELDQIKKLLATTDRQLNKANIPGIPGEMEARLEEADEKIFIVVQSLQEVPLNIDKINMNVAVARRCVEDVNKRAEEMIENVMIIENLIQFGNRHRIKNQLVDEKLAEAEDAFLQFRYVKALEEAAAAVELIDPAAIHRIEEIVQEQLTTIS